MVSGTTYTARDGCLTFDPATELRIKHHSSPSLLTGKDVCIFVTFSHDGIMRNAAYSYYQELMKNDIIVIPCIVTNDLYNARQDNRLSDAASLIYRQNSGWDFSAWADTLKAMPEIWSAKRLFIANDSVFCLPANLKTTIANIRQNAADFIGLTESWQIQHHIQSYFFVLQGRALQQPNIRAFWNDVKPFADKSDVIKAYEATLLNTAQKSGLVCDILFSLEKLFPNTSHADIVYLNPTLDLWETLIHKGFPFIKASLLTRKRSRQTQTIHWENLAAQYGADITAIRQQVKDTLAHKTPFRLRDFLKKHISGFFYQNKISNKNKRIIKICKIPIYKKDV